MKVIRKALYFLRRDFLEAISYRFAFILQLGGIFFSILTFFFLSRLLGKNIPLLQPYGGDYFSFALIGIAFSTYLGVSLNSFSSSIRREQMMGTIESILVTQTPIPFLIIFSSLYSFLFASLHVILYILIGVFFFGVTLEINFISAIFFLSLSILSFCSVGIISASFIMVFKKGDPFTWVFSTLSGLLGGVIYPVKVLPQTLQKVAYFLPITHVLEGMRLALLKGYSLKMLVPEWSFLIIFSLIMLPLSIYLFGRAVRKAKRDGTLIQY